MTDKELYKILQSSMNEKGEKLTVDGDFGPKTKVALAKYEIEITANKRAASVVPPFLTSKDFFGATWIGTNLDMLGRYETDPVLNARFVPEWAKEGLSGYKTLSGNSRAWCSVAVNKALRDSGVKGTGSAGAASHSRWGRSCPFWFGATLPIKHKSGGRHVNFFLYWIDEKKKLAATLDGNRGNRYCIAITDLSGNGDILVPGPRWSNDIADGQSVPMKDVLAKYPMLKVGYTGGSSTT